MNKILLATFIAYAGLGAAVCTSVVTAGSPKEHVIRLTAKRFEFSPQEITVKKGEPVVLEISSEDVRHGFSLPDFAVRADVKPGAVSRVSFTPEKTGRFTFTCDVFCGEDHEDMSGTLKVTE